MRKNIIRYLVVLALGMLVSAGCAKKEIVKPTEEPAPSARPATTAPEAAQPTRPEQPKPSETITETPTREVPVQQEAPAAAAPPSELQSQLQKIYFSFDSSTLSDEARGTLSKNADVLMKNSALKIRVEGNCDERGSDDYNMALGERRAKAAKDYLVNLGVPSDRISVISYGEEKPVDPGHDEAAWSKNRRDEFVIVQ